MNEPLLTNDLNDSINQSINQSTNRPINQSTRRSRKTVPNHSSYELLDRQIDSQSINQSNDTNDSVRIDLGSLTSQSISESINQSNNQSINQSINQSSGKTTQCIPMHLHVWLGYLSFQIPAVLIDSGIIVTASIIHYISINQSINQYDRHSFVVSLIDLSILSVLRSLSIIAFTHYVSRVTKKQVLAQQSISQSINQSINQYDQSTDQYDQPINRYDPPISRSGQSISHRNQSVNHESINQSINQSVNQSVDQSNSSSFEGFAIDVKLGLSLLAVIFSCVLSFEDIVLKLIISQSIDQPLNQSPLTVVLIVITIIASINQSVISIIGLISRRSHVFYLSDLLSNNQSINQSVNQSVHDFFADLQSRLQSINQSINWSVAEAEYAEYRLKLREKEMAKLKSDAKRDADITKKAVSEFGHSDQSINQSSDDKPEIDQSIDQSVNQSTNQSDEKPEESISKWHIVSRLLSLWTEDARLLVAGFIFMLIAAISGLAIPSFTGALLSNALDDKLKMSDMYAWLGLILITGVTTQCRGYLFTYAGENFVARLRRQLHAHLLRLDVAFFDSHAVGDFSAALTADCDILKDSISLNFNVFIRSAIAVIGALIYMLVIDWRLSLVACASLPFFSGLSLTYGSYEKKQSTKIQDLCGSANSSAVQSFGSIRAVHSFHAIEYEDLLYSAKIEESRQLACRKAFWYGCYANITSVLADLGSWNTLLYGSYLLHNDSIKREALAQFLFLSAYMVSQLQNISWIFQGLMKSLGSGERIFRLLDRQPDIWPVDISEHVKHADLDQSINQRKHAAYDALLEEKRVREKNKLLSSLQPQPSIVTINGLAYHCFLPPLGQPYVEPPHEFTGRVTFRNVCFAYPSVANKQVLHGVSFELRPGMSLALVGESGSGKSSIAALIQRFYDVTSGSIEFDGIDIRLLSPAWRSRRVAYVQQEPVMFARSIRDNISYGTSCTQADVEHAARQAHAHDFILRTENGYDSVLGERGCSLSGGQRQRCCIARALVRSPNLLLFDEATSALDTQSEAEVQRAIDAICERKDKAVIVIAHRLSTIRHADRIIVMDSGSISEMGSHEELVKMRGKYFALVQAQMGDKETKNQSINQSNNQSTSQSISQSTNRSNGQSNGQSIDQSVDQSISQSMDEIRPTPSPSPTPLTAVRRDQHESINQSIYQSINALSPSERGTTALLDSC